MMIRMVNDAQTRQRLEMRRRAIEYEAWKIAEQAREEVEHEAVRDANRTPEVEGEYHHPSTRRNCSISPRPPIYSRESHYVLDRKRRYHDNNDWCSPHSSQQGAGREGHFIKRPKLHPRAAMEAYHTSAGGVHHHQVHQENSPYNNIQHHNESFNSSHTPLPPLEVRRTDRSAALWNTKFEELKAFKAKYGTCNVPQCDPENKQLGVWLRNQRTGYNLYKTKGKGRGMTKERIQMLESLGVEWRINAKHVPWQQRFEELKAYAKEYGHCSIPGTDMKHKQLRVWLRNQRKGYSLYKAKGKGRGMTEERIRLLESIGVEWETRKTRSEIPWMKRFDELKAYKAKHGTFNIHHCDDHHKQLARWLSKQRAAYKLLQETGKGPMSDERMKLLNSIGVHL